MKGDSFSEEIRWSPGIILKGAHHSPVYENCETLLGRVNADGYMGFQAGSVETVGNR